MNGVLCSDVYFADTLSDGSVSVLKFLVEHNTVDSHYRERDDGNKGHRGIDDEHQNICTYDCKDGNDHILRSMVGNLCNIKEIIGDPTHDIAGLMTVEVRKGELLKMIEKIAAHIIFNPYPKIMSPTYSYICTHRSQGITGKDQGHEEDDVLQGAFHTYEGQHFPH